MITDTVKNRFDLEDCFKTNLASIPNLSLALPSQIEVNPEMLKPASGGISVWLGGSRLTSDNHDCPIPVDGQFHHYTFTWSVVYGRWQVYVDGNVIEGGMSLSSMYKVQTTVLKKFCHR